MTEPPDEVVAFLQERHAEVAGLALWVRAAVVEADPDLTERVYLRWDGIGFRHPDAGYVCGIFPQADHVRLLFEHGQRLDDADGLLEGEGSQTRYLAIRHPDDSLKQAIQRLVNDAVVHRLAR